MTRGRTVTRQSDRKGNVNTPSFWHCDKVVTVEDVTVEDVTVEDEG